MAKLEMTRATTTRVLDAAAGGKNNFSADRDLVRRYDQAASVTTTAARAVLQFLVRVVRHLAAEGVDQFIIVGSGVPSGLPAGRQLHDVAMGGPGGAPARVVYVENDPMVLALARATIEPITDLVRVVEGDVREIDAILDDGVVRRFLDWDRPLAVLLLSTHSLADDAYVHYVLERVRRAAPDGSYLSLLQTTFDGVPGELLPAIRDLLAMTLPGHAIRGRQEVAALLDGLVLVDPGLVWVPEWRPDGSGTACSDRPSSSGTYGAVARVP
ncbi:SAM-dependent methyltransferase [Nonomuraea sp. NPDC047529]|uniref:SAM-dependent methyltransferase n=1 Tax=Nonomuraea sp. NPDC047529 TaxID=3155623 RepID=UPI00340BBA67